MLTTTRQQHIYEVIRTKGEVRNFQLQNLLGVSDMTIRRDLTELAVRGLLRRVHGGAVASLNTGEELFQTRRVSHTREKMAIAQSAVQLIQPGQRIYIDGSSTAAEFAKSAKAITPLTIVTNSLRVLFETRKTAGVETILLGGSLQADENTISGPLTLRHIASLSLEMAFFSISGFTVESLNYAGPIGVDAKLSMLKHSKTRVLLADSSKWGEGGFIRLCSWNDIDILVTDSEIPQEAVEMIQAQNVKVIRATES